MKLKIGLLLFTAALISAIVALTTRLPKRTGTEAQNIGSTAFAPEPAMPVNTVAPAPIHPPAVEHLALPASATSAIPQIQPAPKVAASAPVVSSPRDAGQIVAELQQFGPDAPGAPISPEQAEKFKQNVAELVRLGVASVPAIQEFLARNIDSDFADFSGGEQLGFSSLRASLFDALTQIGGPEAQAAMLQALQTTAVPAEILELAKNLERQAPGQYSEQIVDAAREALEMSAANQLGSNVEVGPVFRILQNYGGVHPRALQDSAGAEQKNAQ